MEKLVKDGLVRTIGKYQQQTAYNLHFNGIVLGVSNFTIPMLEDLMSKCEIPPAMNQVLSCSTIIVCSIQ